MTQFSIIIPLYNKEKFIGKSVSSVLNQTYRNFELIIVDDGSTDNSLDIVKSFSDARISICSKPNGGVSSARNFGIRKAHTDWIMFLDADDELYPKALENFNDGIKRHPDYKVFLSNFLMIGFDGTEVLYSQITNETFLKNPIKAIWLRRVYSRPGNTVFHKSVLEQQGGYDEDLSYNEDYEFSLRILSYRRACYLPFVSMKYIKCENSASVIAHKYERDLISKVDTLALDSLYKKLIIMNFLLFAKKYVGVDYTKVKKTMKMSFTVLDYLMYYFYCLIRKIRTLL